MDDPAQSASGSDATQPPPAEVEAKADERDKEMLHRTKHIQFLGRTAPIILQNENGPCPLLAICNVLSLKNSLNLSSDIPEISQGKLLSLVAERLIDSNINLNNRDTGFVENQQQNIADAIDLLPRLTTGIDVNIKFRRIDDFEFTPECAIFDLLDIPLYHGWIVDPQDCETADAIGSKSYNTLMGELVSLETQTSVDFAAATTAALRVPSPSLSRGQSFDDSPQIARKGDIEEIPEVTRILKLSEAETPSGLVGDAVADVHSCESDNVKKSELVAQLESVKKNDTEETVKSVESELVTEFKSVKRNDTDETEKNVSLICNNEDTLQITDADLKSTESELLSNNDPSFSNNDQNFPIYPAHEKSRNISDIVDGSDAKIGDGIIQLFSSGEDIPASDNSQDKPRSDEDCRDGSTTTSDVDETNLHHAGCDAKDPPPPSLLSGTVEAVSSSSQKHQPDVPEVLSSSVDVSEPIYEGEECILDSGSSTYETREPVYEGEAVLARQLDLDQVHIGEGVLKSRDGISVEQGKIIRSFMANSCSQLTVYGLFCLKEQVKERELCVFFRNNHFNTMFKYGGELYILATDQGYINQPDLVWEKLNEVNGDTVFVTGNFSEFKMNDGSQNTWDEQTVMASTADYLANIDSAQANSSFSSDLELAIALQKQEFDHQQEQQPPRNVQLPKTDGATGPQASRVTGKLQSSSRPESKSKEKCVVM